jgi:hypothetical protein
MELPEDVIAIIKDYSRPLTNPNWRRLHKMTISNFYGQLCMRSNKSVLEKIRLPAGEEWLKCWSNSFPTEHNWSFYKSNYIEHW